MNYKKVRSPEQVTKMIFNSQDRKIVTRDLPFYASRNEMLRDRVKLITTIRVLEEKVKQLEEELRRLKEGDVTAVPVNKYFDAKEIIVQNILWYGERLSMTTPIIDISTVYNMRKKQERNDNGITI